ncbi:MAG: reverse transcriptase domain-containing protein, partial [Aeromonas sp.]
MRDCHDKLRPTALAFLDLKAFDTITHEALGEAAEQAGLPRPLLAYLGNVQRKSVSVIDSMSIRPGRGVRQGDPLSPILFIMAMEKPISAVRRDIGIGLGSQHLHSIIYADDMILMAESAPDLQAKLNGLTAALEGMGMTLNARKSATITAVKDGRSKAMLLMPAEYIAGVGRIGPLGVTDAQEFLGLSFNWKGRITPKRTEELGRTLEEVRTAPLKPHQRLSILRDFMIPKLIHGLVLGEAHRNTLKKMDMLIRRAVRLWLRLPKDTSLGLLHSTTKQGGLSIPSLQITIPLAQKTRFQKLLRSADSLIQAVIHTKVFRSTLRRTEIPVRKTLVLNSEDAKSEWACKLVSSCDGRDLSETDVDEGSHLWLCNPERVFPRLFIRGIQLRGGTWSTKARASRGRSWQAMDKKCRGGCQDVETLNHILQRCARTHDARCARHNRVLRLLCRKLHRCSLTTSIEPIIPYRRTHMKPDIIVHQSERLLVLDVTVVSGLRM